MAYLNVKMAESPMKFDWDDINVGNNHLDHSENFFARKHFEHERLEEMELKRREIAETEDINLSDIEEQFEGFKIEKIHVTATEQHDDEDKENVDTSHDNDKSIKKDTCHDNDKSIKKELITSPADVGSEACENKGQEPLHDVTVKAPPHVKKIVNLACQWSTQKPIVSKCIASKGAASKSMPPPPQAYLVKDIFQRKRLEAERRRAEEEKKKREFHSRPVPNFNAYHEHMEKRKLPHACTIPVTPQVLKKSKETDEKRRKKLEEWKQKNPAPKFESRPPTVLKEKPFVPQKKPLVIQQAPFNLSTEKRLMERKHYDDIKRKTMEEKKKQVEIEDEERKRREEEHIRELRKAATFKARPNPFKH